MSCVNWRKTFYFLRRINGQLTRLSPGVFPEMTVQAARDRAGEIQTDIYRGKEPTAERRRARTCPTPGEAFAFYLDHHAKPRKRTWQEDQAQYDRHLKSCWAGRRLTTIRRPDVAALHATLGQDNGVYAANRLRSHLARTVAWPTWRDLSAIPELLVLSRRR